MIRAVFFDWSNTLARYIPPREELQSQALREFGINISPQKITPGLSIADRYLFQESAVSPIRLRSPREQAAVFARYEQMVLTEVGADIPTDSDIFSNLLKKLAELYKRLKFVLYDDVLSSLRTLKERGLILALVTNMDADMNPICRELELADYLNFIVTSSEVGASKPQPRIFLSALQYAGVRASEAVHVGDQYDIDIAGAVGVGIQPILLDRYDLFPDVTDCPRIHSLSEVAQYLD